MRERDSGRALKRAIARRKLEDGTYEPKDALREDLKAQLREESGPDAWIGPNTPKCRVIYGTPTLEEPLDDPPASGWGWFLAILAGILAWGALIVLGMCVWSAIKHG